MFNPRSDSKSDRENIVPLVIASFLNGHMTVKRFANSVGRLHV